MDYSLPGSSVQISQARILEWFPSPEDRTGISYISCTGRQILYHWATGEARCGVEVATEWGALTLNSHEESMTSRSPRQWSASFWSTVTPWTVGEKWTECQLHEKCSSRKKQGQRSEAPHQQEGSPLSQISRRDFQRGFAVVLGFMTCELTTGSVHFLTQLGCAYSITWIQIRYISKSTWGCQLRLFHRLPWAGNMTYRDRGPVPPLRIACSPGPTISGEMLPAAQEMLVSVRTGPLGD